MAAAPDHELVATFDYERVSLRVRCHAPAEAACRSNPACGCESYSVLERDEQGWFHIAYNPDFDINGPDDETNLEEVKHRHVSVADWCNYREWMDQGEMEECGPVGEVELGRIPIDFRWNGDYYSWKPAAASDGAL